jgi:5-methylcytosine-specific restriction endonuclease McrA
MDVGLPRDTELDRTQWKLARKRAIASKDHICAICHKPIDMAAPKFSPLSVEVDHIVPRSRGGGLYDLENLQLTHTKCNRKKGAKMASDYDGLTVENPVPLSNNW